MTTAEPSESTKPSRSLSNGREACSGSSFRRLIACMVEKAPIASGSTAASEPPATITSACPRRIISADSPMECALDAHAETWEELGPCWPYLIEYCAAHE